MPVWTRTVRIVFDIFSVATDLREAGAQHLHRQTSYLSLFSTFRQYSSDKERTSNGWPGLTTLAWLAAYSASMSSVLLALATAWISIIASWFCQVSWLGQKKTVPIVAIRGLQTQGQTSPKRGQAGRLQHFALVGLEHRACDDPNSADGLSKKTTVCCGRHADSTVNILNALLADTWESFGSDSLSISIAIVRRPCRNASYTSCNAVPPCK